MDIFWVKLIFLGFIFIISILGGIVPFYANPKRKSFELFLQLGDAFAGGVFLSAGLIHMLPDSDDTLRDAWGASFPFGALFAVVAIYILFLSEKLLEQTTLGSGGADPVADSKRSHSIIEYSRQAGIDGAKPILEQDSGTYTHCEESGLSFHHFHARNKQAAMVLILALGIHSLFAGLGLGGADGYDIVVLLFIAIIAHKFFEAFALGIRLKIWLMPSLLAEEFPSSATQDSVNTTGKKTESELVKNPKKTFLSILFLYSLCTPLGMAIGMAAQTATSGKGAMVVSGISIGLAAGSFMYVAMVEVLPHALEAPLIGPKIIMSLIGTALMAALAVFV
eukprot:TRINITY_DN911_c0_g2_i1.p1 TRINITY_DN911_c0_g2~~TRINITY_DN911_c0_g2_i1.p1  ORF type:complete len:374 (-),score=66.25 TRINITY_DN911_c0_g2_i1:227-1234(-)